MEFDEDEMKCRVTEEQFGMLQANPAILALLRDERLQKIIREIDGAEDRFAALEHRLRTDPHFVKVADEIVLAIGAAVRTPTGVQFVA